MKKTKKILKMEKIMKQKMIIVKKIKMSME